MPDVEERSGTIAALIPGMSSYLLWPLPVLAWIVLLAGLLAEGTRRSRRADLEREIQRMFAPKTKKTKMKAKSGESRLGTLGLPRARA